MSTEKYTPILIVDSDGIAAQVLEYPGCCSDGTTLEEALTNIHAAAASWTEAMNDAVRQIPVKFDVQKESVLIERFPDDLRRRVGRYAVRRRISQREAFADLLEVGLAMEEGRL